MRTKNNIIFSLIILTIIILIPTSFACGPDGEEVQLVNDTIICENGTGTVELTSQKYTINQGEIQIYIEDTCMANGKVINNTAKLTKASNTQCPTPGEYTGLLTYTGSENFVDFNQTVTILVKQIETTITNTELICDNGHTTVNIEAQDNSIINEGIIRVYIEDTCMANGKVINNTAHIMQAENTTTCPAGEYNGLIIYEGSKTYHETQKELKIIVPDHTDLIKAEILENTINTLTNNITIHITAENNATIDCGIIKITINGKTTNKNVENGYVEFSDLNLKNGIQLATIEYNCNNQHYTNTTKNITINKGTGTITIQTNNITTTYKSGETIKGTITDEFNTPIQNITINITIGLKDKTKTYQVVTNENGEYKLDINLSPENYTIKTEYNTTKKETQLIISKTNAQIETNNYTGNYGLSKNLTGKILIANTPVQGETIALNLTRLTNGLWKIYYITTDEQGLYQLPINLAPGKYTAETILQQNKYTTKNTITSIIIS